MKKIFLLFILSILILLSNSSNALAGLIDLGGGLIYDNDFNVTWLQDASYSRTSGYNSTGSMTWFEAMTWSENLIFGGYDDWRLPTTDTTCSGYYNCVNSEMGHLYYEELGNASLLLPDGTINPAWDASYDGSSGYWLVNHVINSGPFFNIETGSSYWSMTEDVHNSEYASSFGFRYGDQSPASWKYSHGTAWAVRDGNSTPVIPEPSTILLLSSGLVGAFFRRKMR